MLNLEISFEMRCKPLFFFIKKNRKGFAVGLKDIFFHLKATPPCIVAKKGFCKEKYPPHHV
jgi:hypothetical protein